MLNIREAIAVEGRYDKNTLSQVVDTLIIETRGFGIFKDPERMALLRRAAERRGLIVLTDSDGAGFVIRNRIKSAVPGKFLKHAYIPDVYGKERRKRQPGKEGKLGVEGMSPQVLEQVLRRAGATFLEEGAPEREVEAEEGVAAERMKLFQILFRLGVSADEEFQIEIPDEMPIVVVSKKVCDLAAHGEVT